MTNGFYVLKILATYPQSQTSNLGGRPSKAQLQQVHAQYLLVKQNGGPQWNYWVRMGELACVAHRHGFSAFAARSRRSQAKTDSASECNTIVSTAAFQSSLKIERNRWINESKTIKAQEDAEEKEVAEQMQGHANQLHMPFLESDSFQVAKAALPGSSCHPPCAFVRIPTDEVAKERGCAVFSFRWFSLQGLFV